MTTLAAISALLAVAWVGAALVGRTAVGAGAVALLAGGALGPGGLGVVGPGLLEGAAPLAEVAVGWLAVALGVSAGVRDGRRIGPGRLAGATALALLTGLAVAAAVAAASGATWPLPLEVILVAGGAGVALAPTARDALAGLATRLGARGPVTDLVCDLAESDDLLPVAATVVLFALVPGAPLAVRFGLAAAAAAGLVLGAVLGLAAALLVRLSPGRDQAAVALFGISLLGIGLSATLGVSSMATGLVLGLVAALLSGQAAALAGLARTLEGAVALPALVLAGALLDPGAHPGLLVVALAAGGAALLAKLLTGPALGLAEPAALRAGAALPVARLSPGPFGVFVGLAFALRLPGRAGATVLAAAACAFLAGELLAAPALRRALRLAGELPAPAPPPGAPAAAVAAAGEGT
ncbi:MAG: potassium transporter Kef [Anaeromyxobacter sp.]|nr:potassium transporter Kef [Anaeromyxobacter sp.]MBL0276553.1 potassium transporter Kef [Anaeromyxobacter sp.]